MEEGKHCGLFIFHDSWLLSNMFNMKKINCIFLYLLQGCSSFEEKNGNILCDDSAYGLRLVSFFAFA